MTKIGLVKTFVFLLTFLLFFGLILVLVAITGKFQNNKEEIKKNINIEQPIGSNISSLKVKGGYVYLLVTGGNISDRVVVVDTKSGSVVSNITLN